MRLSIVALLWIGCSSPTTEPGALDDTGAATTDSMTPLTDTAIATDTSIADSTAPETSPADSGTPITDSAIADSGADTAMPDTAMPDTAMPDLGPPDGCAPHTPITSSVGCGSGGYSPKIYNAPWVCMPELHIVSNYESYAGTTASVTFNSARSGVVLVLWSYKKLAWTVKIGPSASVSKILVKSFQYGSTATAPAGIPIEIDAGSSSPECGFSGSPSDPCVATLEKKYGTKLTSMHYCYNAASFTLN
jgi:hypothetical protein